MYLKLKGLFTPQAVAMHLKALGEIHSTVMDRCFPQRLQRASALIGVSELLRIVRAIPVVSRGGMSLPIDAGSLSAQMIEPLPVKPSHDVTGQALNDLRLVMGEQASLEVWTRGIIEFLRGTCRETTEAIAAQALTGRIEWPVKLDDGSWETYVVDFGPTNAVEPETAWDDGQASLAKVRKHLVAMAHANRAAGFGGKVEYMAGEDAFTALYALAEKHTSTAKMKVEINGDTINVGGFLVHSMDEQFFDPKTKAMRPKVAPDKVVGYSVGAPGAVFYAALDDLDAKLKPLPFFPKPVTLPEGNGYKIIGQSKPLPARASRSLCWSTATSSGA
jgi:hypothetical protein